MRSAAAELVTILYDEGLSHVFLSPGTHATAIRDSLADAEAAGAPHPQPVLCAHEQVALLAAHGHHLASGSVEAVVVGVDQPQVSLGAAIHGVQRDRIPVTLFSEAGPETRPAPIGKWTVGPEEATGLGATARRAFQISRSEPAGLTVVPLSPDALRQPAGEPSRRLPSPRPAAPDEGALEEMAELLATAESPLIIGARVGKHTGSVHHLARLAETLGAPVIDFRSRVNLPQRHPLNAAIEAQGFLASADAILMLDVGLACVPGLGPVPAQAWLLQIDTDCLNVNMPTWTYPVEVAVTADTERALPLLQTLVANRLSGRRDRIEERRARVEAQIQTMRDAWRARATSTEAGDLPDAMLAELDRALPEDALILEEAVRGSGEALRQIERPPGHFFRSVASGPGWSVGAALGARLARPDQPVVALCSQDAFAYGLPTAAFWSAQRAGAPFLTVVLNRLVDASGQAPGGPGPEVVLAARAGGAEAEVVSQPSDVAGAVDRLLATTRDGVCAVLEVRLPG